MPDCLLVATISKSQRMLQRAEALASYPKTIPEVLHEDRA